MFYNDKPVDWLLEHLIYTKICNWEKDMVSWKQTVDVVPTKFYLNGMCVSILRLVSIIYEEE